MGKFIDLTGQRFGRLIVLEKSPVKAKSGSMWVCRCDCGSITTVARCSLVSGHTRTCGCGRKAFLSKEKPGRTHGYSRINSGKCERLYRVWLGMKERCNNPNHVKFGLYGGRGVYVCQEWGNYTSFRQWAIENGYDDAAPRGACTIDRIDNNGPYAPWNCRFVDAHIQRSNQRRCTP